MTKVTCLLTSNQGYAAARANVTDARPSRAIVTRRDAGIDGSPRSVCATWFSTRVN